MNYDKEFIDIFNEFYPFERYIVKNPQPISDSFNDVLLSEIFILSSEGKDCTSDIYIKLLCKDTEFQLAFYDFSDDVREKIRHIIEEEFGNHAWQSLYTYYESNDEYNELIDIIKEQRELIIKKYGQCPIKDSWWLKDERIMKLLES